MKRVGNSLGKSPKASIPISSEIAFGSLLFERRKSLRLTQDDVAVISEVDRTYISLLERGMRAPSLPIILGIAEALQMTPGNLIEEVVRRMNDPTP